MCAHAVAGGFAALFGLSPNDAGFYGIALLMTFTLGPLAWLLIAPELRRDTVPDTPTPVIPTPVANALGELQTAYDVAQTASTRAHELEAAAVRARAEAEAAKAAAVEANKLLTDKHAAYLTLLADNYAPPPVPRAAVPVA